MYINRCVIASAEAETAPGNSWLLSSVVGCPVNGPAHAFLGMFVSVGATWLGTLSTTTQCIRYYFHYNPYLHLHPCPYPHPNPHPNPHLNPHPIPHPNHYFNHQPHHQRRLPRLGPAIMMVWHSSGIPMQGLLVSHNFVETRV